MKLKCEFCEKEFDRRKAEVKRNEKKFRRIFCSNKCSATATANFQKNFTPRTEYLIHDNRKDQYSPFRAFLKNAKMRTGEKNKTQICQENTITLEDLKLLWESQKGRCPYTGWPLNIAKTSGEKIDKTPDRASLDRIDSSKGYTKENVQFVSLIVQYAKNDWNPSVIENFAKSVTTNLTKF